MDKGLCFFAIILVTTWDNTPYTTKKLNTLAIVTIGKSKEQHHNNVDGRNPTHHLGCVRKFVVKNGR